MIADRISLVLSNSLSELDALCQSLEQFGKSLGLSRKIVFEICLAMEELVSNIISYGFADDAVHFIKVAMSHENGILIIRLEDDGVPFNPLKAEEPDCECPIEQRKVGNLGIHLTKKIMDDMVYERRENKNVLTLKKSIKNT
jgi:anti-sigma regulatory factor (Ser/Thr protein kinase)